MRVKTKMFEEPLEMPCKSDNLKGLYVIEVHFLFWPKEYVGLIHMVEVKLLDGVLSYIKIRVLTH